MEPSDAPTLHRWDEDMESMRLQGGWAQAPWGLHTFTKWTEERLSKPPEGDNGIFMIETPDGTPVGAILSHGCERRTGVFSYGIGVAREHRRRGYASDAIRLLVGYFFDELGYQKVNATVYEFNEPSLSMHASLGFVVEGRRRRTVFTQGSHFDEVLLGMTGEEFAAAR